MPHTCARCGREFRDASAELLAGCPDCGGKKFVFERGDLATAGVLEKASRAPEITGQEPSAAQVGAPRGGRKADSAERVESVRILAPGTYELNLRKMSETDDRVVSIGSEGSYMVDLLSMVKPKRKKTGKTRKNDKS